jgi:hypothetical protein
VPGWSLSGLQVATLRRMHSDARSLSKCRYHVKNKPSASTEWTCPVGNGTKSRHINMLGHSTLQQGNRARCTKQAPAIQLHA